MPVGTIIWFAAITPPDGFIECNGQSTSSYPKLAEIVGSNVPDLRGQFVRGWDHGRGVDTGRMFFTQQNSSSAGSLFEVKQTWEVHTAPSLCTVPEDGTWSGSVLVSTTNTNGGLQFRSRSVIGGTRPENIALLPCIKAKWVTQGTGSSGVPIGSVIAWPLAADPDGPDAGKWIECDGRIVDASRYSKLAALMTYVPDYRGVFLRGYGSVITSNFGTVNHQSNELGILQGDAIRNITGRFGGDSYEAEYNIGAFWGSNGGLGNTGTSVGCLHFFDASLVVPTANENRPVNRSVRWLIRAAWDTQGTENSNLEFKVINCGTISNNMRVEYANPFPGYYVHCRLEVCTPSGQWIEPEFVMGGSADTRGSIVSQLLPEDKITLRVGNSQVTNNQCNYLFYNVSSSAARILVWKLTKI